MSTDKYKRHSTAISTAISRVHVQTCELRRRESSRRIAISWLKMHSQGSQPPSAILADLLDLKHQSIGFSHFRSYRSFFLLQTSPILHCTLEQAKSQPTVKGYLVKQCDLFSSWSGYRSCALWSRVVIFFKTNLPETQNDLSVNLPSTLIPGKGGLCAKSWIK